MVTESALTTLAEVGMGIAGFAGVVFAILYSKSTRRVDLTNLSSLITISGALIRFALLPGLLSAAEIDGDLLWTISNIACLTWTIAIVIYRTTMTTQPSLLKGMTK